MFVGHSIPLKSLEVCQHLVLLARSTPGRSLSLPTALPPVLWRCLSDIDRRMMTLPTGRLKTSGEALGKVLLASLRSPGFIHSVMLLTPKAFSQ